LKLLSKLYWLSGLRSLPDEACLSLIKVLKMNKLKCALLFLLSLCCGQLFAQQTADSTYQVRGFIIAAPKPSGLDDFVKFINEELAPRKVNTLVLRVDFNYQYKSHPELRDSAALSKGEVKKILEACKKNNIEVIPQLNPGQLKTTNCWRFTPTLTKHPG